MSMAANGWQAGAGVPLALARYVFVRTKRRGQRKRSSAVCASCQRKFAHTNIPGQRKLLGSVSMHELAA